MTQTFGRRATPLAGDPARMTAPAPGPPPDVADPRLEALAAAARAQRGAAGRDAELRDYAARRQAALGPWRRLAYALTVAPPAAAYLLGVHGLWLAPISLAGLFAPRLLRRARLRWAAELAAEAVARPPAP